MREEAEQESMSLVPTPHGFAIAPTRDGELLTDDHFEQLPEDDKRRVRQAIERITEKLREHLERLIDRGSLLVIDTDLGDASTQLDALGLRTSDAP